VSAAQTCDEFIVATSALWRFLFDPVEYVMNTHRLGRMAQNNGSALLAASLDLPGDPLRANDDETKAPRKFSLEGVGEPSRGHAQ